MCSGKFSLKTNFLLCNTLNMARIVKTFLKYFFLIYFIFYVVFPLSAAVSPKGSPDVIAIGEESRHSTLFIIDIALWNMLKMGKPSDDANIDKFVVKKTGPDNFPEEVKCGIVGDVNVLLLPSCNAASRVLEKQTPSYINTPFLSSGLSPPSA